MLSKEVKQKVVIGLITAAIVGAASWLTAVHSDIATLKAETRPIPEYVRSIDQRLSRIEGALGIDR